MDRGSSRRLISVARSISWKVDDNENHDGNVDGALTDYCEEKKDAGLDDEQIQKLRCPPAIIQFLITSPKAENAPLIKLRQLALASA